MATLVFFHAHPDDESIGTGGIIAKASALGHRVIVVVATKGENGTRPDDLLDPGEELAQRRVAETEEAARILGVHRLEFLGYRDSGMMGRPENDDPRSFWSADIDDAARRLAAAPPTRSRRQAATASSDGLPQLTAPRTPPPGLAVGRGTNSDR